MRCVARTTYYSRINYYWNTIYGRYMIQDYSNKHLIRVVQGKLTVRGHRNSNLCTNSTVQKICMGATVDKMTILNIIMSKNGRFIHSLFISYIVPMYMRHHSPLVRLFRRMHLHNSIYSQGLAKMKMLIILKTLCRSSF